VLYRTLDEIIESAMLTSLERIQRVVTKSINKREYNKKDEKRKALKRK